MAGLRKLKGKWYVRVYLGNGKEKLLPTKTGDRRLAEAYKRKVEEREFLVRAKLVEKLDFKGERLSDAIEAYLSEVHLRLRPGTLKSYRQALNDMKRSVGELDIRQFRQHHLTAIGHYLANRVNPTTVNIRLRGVRTFLNWLVSSGRLELLPGKLPFIKLDDPLPRFFSPREVDQILSKTKNDKMRATFQLLAETGIRRSELFQSSLEEGYLHMKNTKGRRDRMVPLAPKLIPLYYLATEEAYQPDSISKAFLAAMRKAEIEPQGRSLHSLRHSYALREYYRTGDIYFVKQQLGHSNISVTECYLRYPQEYLQRVFGESVERQSRAQFLSQQSPLPSSESFSA